MSKLSFESATSYVHIEQFMFCKQWGIHTLLQRSVKSDFRIVIFREDFKTHHWLHESIHDCHGHKMWAQTSLQWLGFDALMRMKGTDLVIGKIDNSRISLLKEGEARKSLFTNPLTPESKARSQLIRNMFFEWRWQIHARNMFSAYSESCYSGDDIIFRLW